MKRALLVLLLVCGTAQAELSHQLDRWVSPRFPHAREFRVTVTNFMPDDIAGACWPWLGQIFIQPGQGDSTLAHEVGHAIWSRDLTPDQRLQWCVLHIRHPKLIAVKVYPACWHSFAEAFGEYTTEPGLMERKEPEVYLWFRSLVGADLFNPQQKGNP